MGKGMRNCLPICMILGGVGTLFWGFVLTIGFNAIVRTAVPITMQFMKPNASMDVWLESPLALYIMGTLRGASASNSPGNNSLAMGHLSFAMEMEQGSPEEGESFAAVWSEEDGELDSPSRFLFVLTDGDINYAQSFCYIFAVLSIMFAVFLGIGWMTMMC